MTDQPATPVEVFISYSHRDEGLRQQLETHLALLKRQGYPSVWHDGRITAGNEWKAQIDAHLNSAGLILLLISADFIASDYCFGCELTRALERHARGEAAVVPIILRACDWQSASFGALQALPRDGQPVMDRRAWPTADDAWLDVARGAAPDAHPEPVHLTWELAFQRVAGESPAAAQLLQLCAYLAPDSIYLDMLRAGAEFLPEPLAARRGKWA